MAPKFSGSIIFQTVECFRHSEIAEFSNSKHNDKEIARQELKSEGKSATWANLADNMGIYSSKTYENYLKISVEFGRFCASKDGFNLKHIENAKSKHVEAFINHKLEQGISRNYFKQICAAIGKLETILNMTAEKFGTGKQYHWDAALNKVREAAYASFGEKENYNRAYANPQAVLENLSGKYQTAAEIQFYGLARISESTNIKVDQFKGIEIHPVLGEVGKIDIIGKGGKHNIIYIPISTYEKALEMAKERGSFYVNKDTYRDKVNAAANAAGEVKTNVSLATHSLRWNGARERLFAYIESGCTYEQALSKTSKDLSHERISISRIYAEGSRK